MPESYTTIGQRFKKARVAKSLSIADISATTKIQERYIRALEDGDTQHLPGDFYTQAFVRQYASAVGLNEEAILSEDPELAEAPQTDLSSIKLNKDAIVRTGMDTTVPWSSRILRRLPQLFAALGVLAVLTGIWLFMSHQREATQTADSDNRVVATASKSKPKTKKSERKGITGPYVDMDRGTYQVGGNKKLTLKVQAGDTVWLTVTNDNTRTFAGTLARGAEQKIELAKGQTSVTIHTGNPAVTQVLVDGVSYPFVVNGKRLHDLVFTRGEVEKMSSSSSSASQATSSSSQGANE